MAEITIAPVTTAELSEWYVIKKRMAEDRVKEALMRSRIFAYYFPEPKEGTNTVELNDGSGAVIKGTYVVNRAVDMAEVDAYRAAMQEEGNNLPTINFAEMLKFTPELVKSAYNTLTEEERHAFDQCLIIKPGSPQLEIIIPKTKGRK